MSEIKQGEDNLLKDLSRFIEELTHSGRKILDERILKKVKGICKRSNEYVASCYRLLFHQLKENHSEIRFSAFQICNEIFRRSHHFRELVVADIQKIFELTVELNIPLPPPKSAARDLKNLALQTIHEWRKEFGRSYKMLEIGYNYLKHAKQVDFNQLDQQLAAERAQLETEQRRQETIKRVRLQEAAKEFNELLPEIMSAAKTLENCLRLLLPSIDDFFITDRNRTDCSSPVAAKSSPNNNNNDTSRNDPNHSENMEDDNYDDVESSDLRVHGLVNKNFKIDVKIDPGPILIQESCDNEAILENAKGSHMLLLNKYTVHIKKLIQTVTKYSGNDELLKKMLDTKQLIESVVGKYTKLVVHKSYGNNCNGDSDTDSDFEEVPDKDGYEENVENDYLINVEFTDIKKNIPSTSSDWTLLSKENSVEDPTSALSTLAKIGEHTNPVKAKDLTNNFPETTTEESMMVDPIPSTSESKPSQTNLRKEKLLAVAPKLPYDIDLYHWEDEKLSAPVMFSVKAESGTFWSSVSTDELDEIPVPEGASSLRTRVIEFAGKFEPVKWTCRFPLPNGKLCPRQDRFKCPFHGPIVARNELGECTNPDDVKRLADIAEKANVESPDWQDPKLLEDIKQQTGIDLKMPDRSGRRGKRKLDFKTKYPGLTDIKEKQNTPVNRLSKKIFRRSAMKRVANSLDKLDHKRFRDKYGDQFNYMYGTS